MKYYYVLVVLILAYGEILRNRDDVQTNEEPIGYPLPGGCKIST